MILACMLQLVRAMALALALVNLALDMVLGMELLAVMDSWKGEGTLCQVGVAEALPLGEGDTFKVISIAIFFRSFNH